MIGEIIIRTYHVMKRRVAEKPMLRPHFRLWRELKYFDKDTHRVFFFLTFHVFSRFGFLDFGHMISNIFLCQTDLLNYGAKAITPPYL